MLAERRAHDISIGKDVKKKSICEYILTSEANLNVSGIRRIVFSCRSPLAWLTTLLRTSMALRVCVCVCARAFYDESFALDLQFALIRFRKSLT